MDFSEDYEYILRLQDNFDGEGAEAYSPKTAMHSKIIANLLHEKIKDLKIKSMGANPADRGTIDISIELESGRGILLNTGKNLSTSYYGNNPEHKEEPTITGYMISYEKLDEIINWLRA